MSETLESEKTPMKYRVLELYMESCQLISLLKSQILEKHYAEARYTFKRFRISFTEMYYLTRTIENIKDDEITKKLKKWTTYECKKPSKKFFSYSIKLFEDFSELITERGGIL